MKLILSFIAAAILVCGAEHKQIFPAGARPAGPYSPGILVGDFLYITGQGSRDSDGNMGSTPEERVRKCLRNVQSIVEGAGLTMEHIVYSQVYLHKETPYETLNKVWSEFFPKNPPARATVGAFRMPTETMVQINAVAVRDLSMKKPIIPDWYPKNMNIVPAVEAGGKIFIAGFLGRELGTGKVPESPEEQVTLALTRIEQILKAAGLGFEHLVFVNPYHTKSVSRRTLDQLYSKRVEFGYTPARGTIEVSFLPLGANVEFTGVAVRNLADRKVIRPKNMAPSPTASPCVFAIDTLYCSSKAGFIPGPNGGIFADTVEDQVRQTMRNLLDGLEEAGMNFSNTVATTVYLDTIDEFPKMNAIYGKYFPGATPPTRSTLSPLAPIQERKRSASGAYPKLEEISIIAVK
jgi:enamine deaminase RidA (YjgF/YER057c/UK114 family)